MSDELMQQIKQAMEEQRLKAFEEGWEAGYNALWDSLTDVVRTKAIDRKRPAVDGIEGAGEEVAAEAPAADAPRLTPAMQRALEFIRKNPGLRSRDHRGIGQGTLYGMLKAGVLTKREGKFYPAEHG